MFFWEWERLENYLQKNLLFVTDPGKLLNPITSFTITRDKNLKLNLETVSHTKGITEQKERPPGTVRMNTDAVHFENPMGSTAFASGVQSLNRNSKYNPQTNTYQNLEKSSINHFEYKTLEPGPTSYVFEWLANIDSRHYLWPDLTKDKLVSTPTRTFGAGADQISFESESTTENFGRNCIRLKICNYDIILGASKHDDHDAHIKPGYLLFIGAPEENIRKKIRDSLSFFLGFPIVYLGFSTFNSAQRLLSFKAVNAYSMDSRAFKTPTLPPAPISSGYIENEIDSNKLEQMLNSFCEKYDHYGLSSLNWEYWHAVTAPTHMAPAYFGAIIESIQNKYIDEQGSKFNNTILSKPEYKKIKNVILKATEEIEISPNEKKVLLEKLSNGNTISQKVRSQRFFEQLGLDMGTLELSAWQRRNDAAHGNPIPNDDYISLIKETKLLKLTLHRIVLKIINASDLYIDYYSLHFPTRAISSGVPEDGSVQPGGLVNREPSG
ncbi:hypothetical protein ACYZUC_27545 [Pseudomonas sp. GT1P32]